MDLVSRVGLSRVLPAPVERRGRRLALGIGQRELAAELGVTVQTLWAWETGRTTPAGANRHRYAHVLASMSEALRGRGETE